MPLGLGQSTVRQEGSNNHRLFSSACLISLDPVLIFEGDEGADGMDGTGTMRAGRAQTLDFLDLLAAIMGLPQLLAYEWCVT